MEILLLLSQHRKTQSAIANRQKAQTLYIARNLRQMTKKPQFCSIKSPIHKSIGPLSLKHKPSVEFQKKKNLAHSQFSPKGHTGVTVMLPQRPSTLPLHQRTKSNVQNHPRRAHTLALGSTVRPRLARRLAAVRLPTEAIE